MSETPQMVYAVKGGAHTRVHVRRRYLPIIVVPGLMGTRLVDEKVGQLGEGKLVFNPMGKPLGKSPRAMVVKYKRLQSPAELAPAEGHGFKVASQRNAVKHIRHFNNLVTDMYGDLAKRLSELGDTDEFESLGVRPVVYCAGYDWRQDNARSALRLAAVVEEALRETGAKKCIIVAHSMGGIVARYFCRALGGESRVHQLYLLGSPILGVPSAYTQLKHGVHGPYLHDIVEDVRAIADDPKGENVQGLVREGIGLAAQVVRGVTTESFLESVGPIYFALCLGAGKLLRREETAYFARQLASIYQLMPNRLFCHKYKHWVVFDPLVTGHPPTGHMVVFPGVLEATMMGAADIVQAVEGGASRAGEEARDAYNEALVLGRHERTSPRAHRNVTTIDDLIDHLVEGAKAMADEDDFSHTKEMMEAVHEMYERVEHAFVNCESPKHLYEDIYTGLMDNVAQRPLVAGKLALAERLDRALAAGKDRHKEHALSIFHSVLHPILAAAGLGGHGGGHAPTPNAGEGHTNSHGEHGEGHEGEGHGEQQQSSHGEEHKLKAYVHPRTTCIYASHLEVEMGCALIPTDIVSYDDSNEVKYELIPFPFGLKGDGTVPEHSAHPAAEMLTHAFEHTETIAASHSGLASETAVTACLSRHINSGLDSWLEGER